MSNPMAPPTKCNECGLHFRAAKQPRHFGGHPICDECWNARKTEIAATFEAAKPPPNFAFLHVAASVVTALGIVVIILGVTAGLLLAPFALSAENLVLIIGPVLAYIAGGILCAALGQSMECLRVIAINSFYIREQTKK